jgi:hypothetical protein
VRFCLRECAGNAEGGSMMLDRPKLCIVGSGINGNGFLDFCSDAQGIEACEESHPRPTNLELKLVYVIRAPGAGINLRPIPLYI